MPLLSSKPSPCLAWRTSAASSPLSRDHVWSPGKPFSTWHPEWRLTDLPLHLNHLAPFPSHLCLTSLPGAPNALAAWPFLLCFSSESPHQSLCLLFLLLATVCSSLHVTASSSSFRTYLSSDVTSPIQRWLSPHTATLESGKLAHVHIAQNKSKQTNKNASWK